ncbi:MAG: 4Fe-4S dicluster domain-containing protein [Firmicutes bacterium]|nr:4Fe-4S dicluster domain-containing protein [Bacillota bacterium]
MDEQSGGRSLSRRRFLKAVGLLGTGAAAVGTGLTRLDPSALVQRASAAEAADPKAHQWVFVMDLRLCDGCEKCTDACRKQHYLPKEQSWIKVYKLKGASGMEFFLPRTCQMCENAPCLKVCPVKATFKDHEGIVLVDQAKCIGCRICMAACPYEARYFNFDTPPEAPASLGPARPEFPVPQQRGTVGKCVFCIHNLRFGKIPGCIEACSMEALFVGDYHLDLATNGRKTVQLSKFIQENDAVLYKEDLNTRPRVYYILGHGQDLGH